MTPTSERLTGLEKEVDLLSAEAVALRKRVATTWGRAADRLPSGRMLFTQGDGLLLLGSGSDIWKVGSAYRWMSTRMHKASVTGAIHWVPGRWPGSQAFVVEDGTTNYVHNPSFENDEANWAFNAGVATHARSQTHARFGLYSEKVTFQAGNPDWYTTSNPVADGSTWTASVWVFVKSGNASLRLYESFVGTISSIVYSTKVGEWERLTVTATDTGSSNDVCVTLATSDTSSEYYTDGAQLEKAGFSTCYCDGDQGTGYAWNGAAHGSTSYRVNTAVLLPDLYAPLIDGNTQYTMHLWAKPQYDSGGTWPSDWALLYDIRFGSNSNRTYFEWYRPSEAWILYLNGAYHGSCAGTSFSAGDWLMLDVTYDFDADVYRFYVNGVRRASNFDAASPLSSSGGALGWGIGSSYAGGTRNGWAFAEYAMFDRVLTPSEISVLYHNQRSLIDEVAFHRPLARGRYYYDTDNSRIYELTPNGLKYIALT